MGKVFIVGLMVEDIKDNTKMIKNMVREYISGRMVENTMENGWMEISMEKEYIMLTRLQSMENGLMGKEWDGLMNGKLLYNDIIDNNIFLF